MIFYVTANYAIRMFLEKNYFYFANRFHLIIHIWLQQHFHKIRLRLSLLSFRLVGNAFELISRLAALSSVERVPAESDVSVRLVFSLLLNIASRFRCLVF